VTNGSTVARPGPRDRAWSLLIKIPAVCGVALLLIVAYQMFGNVTHVHQDQQRLEQQWSSSLGEQVGFDSASGLVEPPKPLPGNAIARIAIPSLNQKWIVVEGTAAQDIATAPGHYSGTAFPGQKGNFAVAGHREIGIFWDLDKVKVGAEIIVETRKDTYTYTVTRNFITAPDSWAEVSAVPPGFKKGAKVLTLTTCDPKWDNYHRLVVHAVLRSG